MLKNDLTGRRFGYLTVICRGPDKRNNSVLRPNGCVVVTWIVRCDCGTEKQINYASLVRGFTSSCGCMSIRLRTAKRTTHGCSRNGNETAEYRAWKAMITRCKNTRTKSYQNYGGRGVRVCDKWENSFEAFLSDVGAKPGPEYTLDRIDVNGDYCPENCKWATRKEQNRNKRTTLRDDNGEPLQTRAEREGINYWTVKDRYKNGLRGDALFRKPREAGEE